MKRSTPESSSSASETDETPFSTICSSISEDPEQQDRQKQTLIQIANDVYNLTLSPKTELRQMCKLLTTEENIIRFRSEKRSRNRCKDINVSFQKVAQCAKRLMETDPERYAWLKELEAIAPHKLADGLCFVGVTEFGYDDVEITDMSRHCDRLVKDAKAAKPWSSECSICMSDFGLDEGRMLACGHTFDKACLDKALATNKRCPMCRANVAGDAVPLSFVARQLGLEREKRIGKAEIRAREMLAERRARKEAKERAKMLFLSKFQKPFQFSQTIAAGGYHSLALLRDGTVRAWGRNHNGQTNVPAGLANVVQVAAGGYHSLAVLKDGTVRAWGDNDNGQARVPAGLENVVQVAAGLFYSLALLKDGTVRAWGHNGYGQTDVPVGLENVVQVAAGGMHSLALLKDGTVRAWGRNHNGQTNVPAGLENVVQVAAGTQHSLAVLSDGTVRAWGRNDYGQTNVPAGLENVVQVAAGIMHSLALLKDGTVRAWGDNKDGQTEVPDGLENVVQVAAGLFHSLALLKDGTVRAWGDVQDVPDAIQGDVMVPQQT